MSHRSSNASVGLVGKTAIAEAAECTVASWFFTDGSINKKEPHALQARLAQIAAQTLMPCACNA